MIVELLRITHCRIALTAIHAQSTETAAATATNGPVDHDATPTKPTAATAAANALTIFRCIVGDRRTDSPSTGPPATC